MKSYKKKLIEEEGELVLEISIEDKDSELFERLKRIATTHKLPRTAGKRRK